MEADSTTYENSSNFENLKDTVCLPFSVCPGNLALYKEFINNNGERCIESQIVERLQNFGLLPALVKCPTSNSDCKVVLKMARVIDRVQWVCEGCGKRQSIRVGSFFFKLQCSILQVLQITLAWCEDADLDVASQYFDIKPRVASAIYDRLDELSIKELNTQKLGGENSVVLAEIYPDCLNRLSPDTTDQPHVNRILMLADTKHIPTHYRLHVIKGDSKKLDNGHAEDEILKAEVETALRNLTEPQSMIVLGNSVPYINGYTSYQHLVQHCDIDMQRFLSARVWRQALCVCAAARELRAGAAQRYLDAALHRLRHPRALYERTLRLLCRDFTHNYHL